MERDSNQMSNEQLVALLEDHIQPTDGQTPAQAVARLVTPYVVDPERADPATDRALAATMVRSESALIRDAAEVFSHNTRPLFVVGLAAGVAVVGGAALWLVDPPGRDTWLALLLVAMAYLCMRILPRWRRQVPVLRELSDRLELLADRLAADENPVNTLAEIMELRVLGSTILTKGGYAGPLFPQNDRLLLRMSEERQD